MHTKIASDALERLSCWAPSAMQACVKQKTARQSDCCHGRTTSAAMKPNSQRTESSSNTSNANTISQSTSAQNALVCHNSCPLLVTSSSKFHWPAPQAHTKIQGKLQQQQQSKESNMKTKFFKWGSSWNLECSETGKVWRSLETASTRCRHPRSPRCGCSFILSTEPDRVRDPIIWQASWSLRCIHAV